MSCLQYYYENEENSKKYKIDCKDRIFENLENVDKFNNKDLLDFIDTNYGSDGFPLAENSPLSFDENYINLSNDEICKKTDLNLAPQQKFMGQIMGPNSNFNNMLIYHGLGSGKSCTSIVIGEALKNSSNKTLIYAVPAPLVDQYFEEIIGEIRNGKFFSCPSFCLVKKGGKDLERDFYVSDKKNSTLTFKANELEKEKQKLLNIGLEIEENPDNNMLKKKYKDQENNVENLKNYYKQFQLALKKDIIKTFEIVSHQTFIESLYKTGENGIFIKKDRLLKDNAIFHENGLLIIDEIQRLVSAGGTFYKKLLNTIRYYCHKKLKVVLMSATPVYDNPFELALTVNLLRPRIPFPSNKKDFYNFFIGEKSPNGECIKSKKDWISENSCLLNEELISYICSGYVSYFKGGNPNAYPYKRIITMEHLFSPTHKTEYIQALKSDISKDKKKLTTDKNMNAYENILLGNYETEEEDKITGMFVISQQYSNISLPRAARDENINKTSNDKKKSLEIFKKQLRDQKFNNIPDIITYVKKFSVKLATIVELTLTCNGPVFIFSNWLTFGVEPLAIVLEICGLVSFEERDKGKGKFFVWSSETKTKDKSGDLIKKARNTFNSVDNKDGNLLKVILGTRSVMEGVSFKNVKQVHITEPWWNESRIEQILARASRYCSHSNLPLEEQYVDIYRHYSILSKDKVKDPEIMGMLDELNQGGGYKDYETLGIDEKMLISSLKKHDINIDLNNILKKSSIDCNLNKNGNLVRLEENVIPLKTGFYQVYYKNPSNGRYYSRRGVPKELTFEQIYNRVYSYPNKQDLYFTESYQGETGYFEPYDDAEILKEPIINKDMILNENIKSWYSNKTFDDIEMIPDVKKYFIRLYKANNLVPILRKKYLQEKGQDYITFKDDTSKRINLIKCIKELANKNIVSKEIKKEIAKEFNKESFNKRINSHVLDLVFKYKAYPETYLEELINIAASDPDSIIELHKTFQKK